MVLAIYLIFILFLQSNEWLDTFVVKKLCAQSMILFLMFWFLWFWIMCKTLFGILFSGYVWCLVSLGGQQSQEQDRGRGFVWHRYPRKTLNETWKRGREGFGWWKREEMGCTQHITGWRRHYAKTPLWIWDVQLKTFIHASAAFSFLHNSKRKGEQPYLTLQKKKTTTIMINNIRITLSPKFNSVYF